MKVPNSKIVSEVFAIACSLIPHANARVAAAVVYKNKIVSIGYNNPKTHPFHAKYKKNETALSFHAETHAIYNATKALYINDFSSYDLYVIRAKTVRGKTKWYMGTAAPCVGCVKCITDYKFKNVFYSVEHNIIKDVQMLKRL